MATNTQATREKSLKQWDENLKKQFSDIKDSLGNCKTEDEVIKNILKLEDITQLEKFNSNSDVKAYVLDINEKMQKIRSNFEWSNVILLMATIEVFLVYLREVISKEEKKEMAVVLEKVFSVLAENSAKIVEFCSPISFYLFIF